MKLILASFAVALGLCAAPVRAQEAAAAAPAEAASPLSFNISVTSDYRYRGISQTRLKPALQGGIDYAAANGFYIGTWASTINWIKDVGGDANVEIDVYGGFKTEIASGLNLDVGVLTYVYPSNGLHPSANTTEIYGALSFGPVTAKYSHALTDTFANPDSKNSAYFDVTASFDVYEGLMLVPHVGHQKIKGPVGSAASYTDYSLTLSKDFNGWVPSIAVVGTDADESFYTVKDKYLGKTSVVVALKYTF
jgi:uncharacterized protein (TIGR02001 family)